MSTTDRPTVVNLGTNVIAFLFRSFKNKWLRPSPDTTESYAGRNVLVTGATAGLGLEAAAKFASLGASKVIIGARNLEKGKTVKADIESRTGRTGQLEVWELDMDSYDSILAFAERAHSLDHLDVAVLNAGLRKFEFTRSAYGWEEDLQVNTLSNVLLAILLLSKLKTSENAAGKIPILEFVNSGTHQRIKLDPAALESDNILEAYCSPELFKSGKQYAVSKLFLMYATNKIAEETSSVDVIVTSVCPGLVQSDLARDLKFPGKWLALLMFNALLMKKPEQGARIVLSGTTQGEQVHGRFWKDDEIQPLAPTIAGDDNRKLASRVWDEIIEALSRDVPKAEVAVSAIVKS